VGLLRRVATFKSSLGAARHSPACEAEALYVVLCDLKFTMLLSLLIYILNNLCEGPLFLPNRAQLNLT